ncbi:MAG: M3 family oligoendopeptidase, partial [Pseudomonadota bacterium]|nr:M3 family oligoendopeptidase [Pseudomonadota bacterium]
MNTVKLNNLTPKWNLHDLYLGLNDPKIQEDLAIADQLAKEINENYKGQLTELSGDIFGELISQYEKLNEVLGRISSFAQLMFAGDAENPDVTRFYQNMNEKIAKILSYTLFIEVEINYINEEGFCKILQDKNVSRYAPWLKKKRLLKPHQLSSDLEQILHEKTATGTMAWSRLFDETIAGLRFNWGEETITCGDILNKIADKDPGIREDAAKTLGRGLEQQAKIFALITNTLAKDKHIDDTWRNFRRPVSSRNLSNQVEDEVVDALVEAVRENYKGLSHRYYQIKAKWLGLEILDYWDRNAPLPEADEAYIPWEEGKAIVIDSYDSFHPHLADIARTFFEGSWIDAEPRPGKDPGAFSHPTIPSVHPYILMNYHGKSRDVMTLAHEIGHGIHQTLSNANGCFLSETPLTLAETASVFGEMLTFKQLIQLAKTQQRRKVLIASKVEDMLNTVIRQIAFYSFEEQVHQERQKGELSAERLGEIWIKVQKESLGPAFRFSSEYQYYWS